MTATTITIQSAVIAAIRDRQLIGTVSRPDLDDQAGLMAANQVIRHIAPTWLWLAGINPQGDALNALPELTSWGDVAAADRLAREALRAAEAARETCCEMVDPDAYYDDCCDGGASIDVAEHRILMGEFWGAVCSLWPSRPSLSWFNK